jgi:hypothetical protein
MMDRQIHQNTFELHITATPQNLRALSCCAEIPEAYPLDRVIEWKESGEIMVGGKKRADASARALGTEFKYIGIATLQKDNQVFDGKSEIRGHAVELPSKSHCLVPTVIATHQAC